ncbi:hypothetical protein JP75_06350 [Devosia riboflavina]|uniref:GGDEF domain-containing protein n=1 Tax=Devosia riboflavina TaxID=46914 RepID=A0A087M554_9HYPH|nr:diguanylate cyclase [Devosia riboflavina]KFL32007.1 hypothetical protein JP75_06350 [Devosia riboflavina]
MQLRDTTHFTTRFLLPIVVVTGITILALAGFLAWSAQRIDADALAREKLLLERALQEQKSQMYIAQEELAVWDEAVTALDTGDVQWLVDNLGVYAFDFYGHNRSFVLDSALKPIVAVSDGGQVPAKSSADAIEKLAPFFAHLRSLDAQAAISAYNAGVSDTLPQAIDFTLFEGQPALVAVTPVLSYSGENAPTVGKEGFYISVGLLGDELATYFGDQYRIDQPIFLDAKPQTDASLPILNAQGQTLAWLTWQPEHPGARLVGAAMPALLAALVIGIIIVGLLLRSLRSALFQLQAEREEAHHRAQHDPLTGLGNRALFRGRLGELLQHTPECSPRFAVLELDLDKFKQVNDTLGHQAGDEMLVEVGTRIKSLLRPEDTLIRLGGDEFAIIQPNIADHREPQALAQAIIDALTQPVSLAAGTATIGVSIGIATAPDMARSEADLIRFADDALYRAKNGGRNRYCLYSAAPANEPARVDTQLRDAFAARRASA